MYILLEEGMEIRHGDESLNEDYVWEDVGMCVGGEYQSVHFVMRREIKTIEDLVSAYNA